MLSAAASLLAIATCCNGSNVENDWHDLLGRRVLQDSEIAFVRASVDGVTNGGKLTLSFDHELEFPDDIIDQLNVG